MTSRRAGRLAVLLLTASALAGCSLWLMRTSLLNALLYFPTPVIELSPDDLGLPFTELSFETEDGERLHGFWIPTRRPPATAHVLHLHGNAGNVGARVPQAFVLAHGGFDVLLFDYRGYGRSTGRPDEEGTYSDARAARAELLRQAGVDPGQVVYLGESLGGAVAAQLALEAPPRGLVLQATFTSVKDMARLHYPVVPGFMVPDAYPTAERVGQVRAPILVVHGDRDEIVPLSHGEALRRAAGDRATLHVVPGAGHNDLVETAGEGYAGVLSAWLAALPRR